MATSSVTNRSRPQVQNRSAPVEDGEPSKELKKKSDSVPGPQTRKAQQSVPGKGGDSFEPGIQGAPTQSKPSKTSSSTKRLSPEKRAYADNTKKVAEAKAEPSYASELKEITNMSQEKRNQIDEIARKADLPPALVAGIWYREASLKDGVYLHNGDPLGKPTTHVPKGKSFGKDQFIDAAVDALKDKASIQKSLDLHYDSTDLGAMATYAEMYNGGGYRKGGHTNPYVFAGTDQYTKGLYKEDSKYSPDVIDRRLGVVPVMQEYLKH